MSKKTAHRHRAQQAAAKRPATAPKTTPRKPRARPQSKAAKTTSGSKLDRIVAALRAPKGATIANLMKLTGWQAHSVRGALSGSLKRDRSLAIVSEKRDDERVYRIEV
jgi:hypothetical protein